MLELLQLASCYAIMALLDSGVDLEMRQCPAIFQKIFVVNTPRQLTTQAGDSKTLYAPIFGSNSPGSSSDRMYP